MSNCRISDIGDFVSAHDSFAVISHVSPDGDTLGTALALCSILRALGKTARPFCDGAVPEIYRFLSGSDGFSAAADGAFKADAAIAVDCADRSRMGECAALFDSASATLEIDHHETNPGYAALDYICPNAAATGLVLWRIASELGWPVDKYAAECLFVALLTDTGGFSYSNTDSDAFAAVSELLAAFPIDVAGINNLVYRTVPYAKTKLLGRAIEKASLYCGGRVAASSLTLDDRHEFGALGGDFDGIVEHLRDISTVEIAIFIRETDEGQKVSLRSTGDRDVSAVSARFGGGGHRNAAGFTSKRPVAELMVEMIRSAAAILGEEA